MTAPTFDLSWNAPVVQVLSALEVQCAVICASAPIFWPTLVSSLHLDRILVVHEVVVSNERRKPPSRPRWTRPSESSETELRELAASTDDESGRVYGKDTYITGWEVDEVEQKGNHAIAGRADQMPDPHGLAQPTSSLQLHSDCKTFHSR
jgi:hypothetical protein